MSLRGRMYADPRLAAALSAGESRSMCREYMFAARYRSTNNAELRALHVRSARDAHRKYVRYARQAVQS